MTMRASFHSSAGSSMMSDSFTGGDSLPLASSINSSGMNRSQQLSGAPATPGSLVVEEMGTLVLGDVVPRKITVLGNAMAILSDDGRLVLGEVRSRGGDDWALHGRSVTQLNDADRRYLDLALVANSPSPASSSSAGGATQGQGAAVAAPPAVGGGGNPQLSVVFLMERTKNNRERCLTAHNIRHNGKVLELREEFTSYDKVNVLGKGVSHIAAGGAAVDQVADMPSVYAVSSNLVRKLRLEDCGTNLKPTTARAQVPADCQDNALAICVQPCPPPGSISAAASATPVHKTSVTSAGTSSQVNVIIAFKSKSASSVVSSSTGAGGKVGNRYTVEFFNAKSKGSAGVDEIVNSKSTVRFGDDNEPTVLLTDPRDHAATTGGRGSSNLVYALCVDKNNGTTALHKLAKGRRVTADEPPVRTFNYEIRTAAMMASLPPGSTASTTGGASMLYLIAYDAIGDVARIYNLRKTEGFRGDHPGCATAVTPVGGCPPSMGPLRCPAHVVSCATSKWRLTAEQVEHVIGISRPMVRLALATLSASTTMPEQQQQQPVTVFLTEPESGHPYRVRVTGCEAQGLHPEVVVLDDLDHVFETADDHLLRQMSGSVLKMCLGHTPCRDCLSKLSGWLMNGRLASIELYYVRPPGGHGQHHHQVAGFGHGHHLIDPENHHDGEAPTSGSERLTLKPITAERFRALVSDIDWTLTLNLTTQASPTFSAGNGGVHQGRQATFTLEGDETPKGNNQQQQRAASASCNNSRIPTPRASVERSMSGRLSSMSMTSSSSGPPSSTISSSVPAAQTELNTNSHQTAPLSMVDAGVGPQDSSTAAGNKGEDNIKIQRLRALVKKLSAKLNTVIDIDASLRSNLHGLREEVEDILVQTNDSY